MVEQLKKVTTIAMATPDSPSDNCWLIYNDKYNWSVYEQTLFEGLQIITETS